MRVIPLVGRKLWFGPRRWGWGWDPVSWEGWLSLAGWVAVCAAAGAFLPEGLKGSGVGFGGVGVLLTCILKGTRPGGPEAKERLRELRRNARRTPEQIEAERQRRLHTEDEPSVTDAAQRLRLRRRSTRPGAS